MVNEEYLTIEEVAARLKVTSKTIRNKMANGVFKRGEHYFRPAGMRPRFKWSAVVAWIESESKKSGLLTTERIPMARGYYLGEPGSHFVGSFRSRRRR